MQAPWAFWRPARLAYFQGRNATGGGSLLSKYAKFVTGAVLFISSIAIRLLDSFQRLDYLKTHLPDVYSFTLDPIVDMALVLIGITVMAFGAYQIWMLRKETVTIKERQRIKEFDASMHPFTGRLEAQPKAILPWVWNRLRGIFKSLS